MTKKFILKYKDICGDNSYSIKEVLLKSLKAGLKDTYIFTDSKNKKHNCQIQIYETDGKYIFGRFGEIKNSNVENGVAIVNGVETDADFKYHVQFLIKLSTCEMDFIYNSKATCFDEAFEYYISDKNNLVFFKLFNKSDDGLERKIRKARKIQYINVKKDNSDEVKGIFHEFFDYSMYQVDIKVKFRKKASINNDKMVDFFKQHKNDRLFSVRLVDEYNNKITKNFADDLFFKTKTLEINPEKIKDNDYVLEELKRNLENVNA